MKTCVMIVLMGVSSTVGFAQTITAYTGSFGHGSTLTITGAGFGTKAQAAPATWDNVESGSFNPNWQSTHSLVVGTESRHANSSFCGTQNFQGSGGNGGNAYFSGDGNTLGTKWFCQYWFKLDPNWDWGTTGYGNMGANLANIKIFRMWNPGSINENFVMATRGYAGPNIQYYAEHVSNPQGGYFENVNNWTKGVWHCIQFQFGDSSVGGNDGNIKVWLDGVQVLNDVDLMTRDQFSQLKRPYILGFFNSWSDGGTDRDDFFIDDAYIDNSWARVEVGNNAVYNSCTHREVQIPTAWSSSSVTVDVNAGSFVAGDALYLFVVNDQGVPSSGFPLGGSVQAPGIPGTPAIAGP